MVIKRKMEIQTLALTDSKERRREYDLYALERFIRKLSVV